MEFNEIDAKFLQLQYIDAKKKAQKAVMESKIREILKKYDTGHLAYIKLASKELADYFTQKLNEHRETIIEEIELNPKLINLKEN